ncbi:MAG: AGE family epimerase/isomerase [Clostridia bacterium]|nr:AGE family epimerase/isomerase [Clostridia bacterium]
MRKTVSLFLAIALLSCGSLAACTAKDAASTDALTTVTTAPSADLSDPAGTVADENLTRAKALANAVFTKYYQKQSVALQEELPANGQYASIWDYMTVLSMVNRILALDPADAEFDALRDSLLDGLDYYGQPRTDQYQNTVYASRRTNTKWNASADVCYDDQIWLIREFLNVYESTGRQEYLERAEKLTDFVLTEGWEPDEGGIYWMVGGTTRNTCSNAPMIGALVRLYHLTGQQSYLDWAIKIYDWVNEHLLDSNGLYSDHVGTTYDEDGKAIDTHPPATDKHAYNTGSMIYGGVLLYEATGKNAYLVKAKQSAAAAYRYFTESVKTDEGSVPQYKITTNTWFNLILMEGFLELAEYDATADKALRAMQASIDYGYTHNLRNGLLPKLYVSGDSDSKRRLIDMTANAEIYALLSQYQQAASEN